MVEKDIFDSIGLKTDDVDSIKRNANEDGVKIQGKELSIIQKTIILLIPLLLPRK